LLSQFSEKKYQYLMIIHDDDLTTFQENDLDQLKQLFFVFFISI
jgi:hypothetical protein